ncbi:MAG: lytic transglycosylase domain-containing protein, partial [Asticcacaulis sp.]
FKGAPPLTTEGAMALITAYAAVGRTPEARALAKSWWRTKIFDSVPQSTFYQAFGSYLTPDDHKARLTCLEINFQRGSSQDIRDMTAYVDAQQTAIANAVIAMRSSAASSDSLYQAALAGDPHNRTLAFARAKYLYGKGLETLGYGVLPDLPSAALSPDAASQLYSLRLGYFKNALKARNYTAAYDAMNGGGFEPGESMAEAEFFAGWIALIKLNNADLAIKHFQALSTAGTSPITLGRAYYWLGRAYEARNRPAATGNPADAATAKAYYLKGSQYIYAFYGQMAAEKAGIKTITLGKDPIPTAADRARFESRDQVKAVRLLGSLGEIDLFRALVLNLDDILPNAEEEALLVDLVGQYDTQLMAMKVARVSMQRGFYLPERAYPVRSVPDVPGPEKAFVMAITRQESSFDPTVRSGANARGMMQLIPSTARAVARRLGLSYSDASLYEPDYNMTLGTYHLGELVDRFDGSYIMTAAGYNAGPSRMSTWISTCGDPRGDGADALFFIECHPFTETRNYMMRVTENMRVYRARLNGGTAPLTAMADITRGYVGPIGTNGDDDDSGAPEAPIGYLDYTKGQAARPPGLGDKPVMKPMTVPPKP